MLGTGLCVTDGGPELWMRVHLTALLVAVSAHAGDLLVYDRRRQQTREHLMALLGDVKP
jgi:hypothetical protein